MAHGGSLGPQQAVPWSREFFPSHHKLRRSQEIFRMLQYKTISLATLMTLVAFVGPVGAQHPLGQSPVYPNPTYGNPGYGNQPYNNQGFQQHNQNPQLQPKTGSILNIQGKQVRVNWGPFGDYWNVLKLEVGMKKTKAPITGVITDVLAMSFFLEVKNDPSFAILYARFYDAQGVEVRLFSPLVVEPPPVWPRPGDRFRGYVYLPNMSQVAEIRFTQVVY